MENLFQMELTAAQVNEIPNLSLALVGDGVYELMCRTHRCAGGDRKLLNLQKDTVEMVKAPASPDRGGAGLLPPGQKCPHPRCPQGGHPAGVPKGHRP